MKIYLASSWRNDLQPEVLQALRDAGHDVYDFRNPAEGNTGFHWSAIDPAWQSWDAETYRNCLEHPVSVAGFGLDWGAMRAADACVLLLPCGRSAHIEAGYFVGAYKRLFILLAGTSEPELMYRMAYETGGEICCNVAELLLAIEHAGAPV